VIASNAAAKERSNEQYDEVGQETFEDDNRSMPSSDSAVSGVPGATGA
jgi:hypothetical protein